MRIPLLAVLLSGILFVWNQNAYCQISSTNSTPDTNKTQTKIASDTSKKDTSTLLKPADTTVMKQVDSSVVVLKAQNYEDSVNREIGIGDYVKITVKNLGTLTASMDEKNNPLLLYVNDVPMRGLQPLFIDTSRGTVVYKLTRDSVSLPFWNIFYHFHFFERVPKVTLSIGLENKGAVKSDDSDASTLRLVIWDIIPFGVFLIVFGFTVIFFIHLVKKTTILKDTNTSPSVTVAPYSLSKSQFAWWTFITAGSFFFILLTTGQIPVFTGSTLTLLLISVGTSVGAKAIDFSHGNNQNIMNSTGSWFNDVLSDNNGMSIHRFQMFLWTAILGGYFIYYLIVNLSFPQFSNEILALMGISNGAYLGLRVPEDAKQNTDKGKPAQDTKSNP